MQFGRERRTGKKHGRNHLAAMFVLGITSGGILGLLAGDSHNHAVNFALTVVFSVGLGIAMAFTVAPKRIARIAAKRINRPRENQKLTLPAIPKQASGKDK